jgi:acetyl-CoA acetyltransferase
MKVRSGWEELVVAGGIESMSRVPMGSDGGAMWDDYEVMAQLDIVPQGISADLIASLEGFSRADVDGYALRSQQRAAIAQQNGHFSSIVPVRAADGRVLLDCDEHARPDATLEGLGALKPAFVNLGRDGLRRRGPAQVPAAERRSTTSTPPVTRRASSMGRRWCWSGQRKRARRWGCGRGRGSSRPRCWATSRRLC